MTQTRPTTGIIPKRGMHLVAGDVVCFRDGTKYRIHTVSQDGPITVAGVWEIVDRRRANVLTRREWRIRTFRLWQDKFYSTLKKERAS